MSETTELHGGILVTSFGQQVLFVDKSRYVATMKKLVLNRTENPFETWGNQKGHGIQLRGFLVAGIASIRIFGLGNDRATVVIIEMRYDEDERNNRRGYDLIVKRRFYRRLGVTHLWHVDLEARALMVNRLIDGHWLELAVFGDEDIARAEPFDTIDIRLADLWG